MKSQFALVCAAGAAGLLLGGCYTVTSPGGEALVLGPGVDDIASIANDIDPVGAPDLDQSEATLLQIVELCRNSARTPDEVTLLSERYGRSYRALRAARDSFQQEASSNIPNSADRYRHYADLLDGLPHPDEFMCPDRRFEVYWGEKTPQGAYAARLAREDAELLAHYPITLSGGRGQVRVPATGIGFRSEGAGTERFAGESPVKLDTTHIQLDFRMPDSSWNYFGFYRYEWGDGQASFATPANSGIDSGFVYGALSPSGSSGLNLGDIAGLSGVIDTDYRTHMLKLGAEPVQKDTGWSVELFAQAFWADRSLNATAQTDAYGSNFSQTRWQSLSDDYYGLGAGVRYREPFTHTGDLGFAAGVSGGVYGRWSRLGSMETMDCPLCPAADRMFSINIDDSDSGIAFLGEIGGEIYYNLSVQTSLGLSASASYASSAGEVFNPSSGDQIYYDGLTTSLGHGPISSYRWTVSLRSTF